MSIIEHIHHKHKYCITLTMECVQVFHLPLYRLMWKKGANNDNQHSFTYHHFFSMLSQTNSTLSQTSRFLCVCTTSLLKTLWEKEKLLLMSNFSFSHSVFYPLGKLSVIFIKFEIVSCQIFQFGRV